MKITTDLPGHSNIVHFIHMV